MINRLCHTAKVHSWLRHACYISGTPGLTTSCPPILALCGFMKRPLWLNTRSTGAGVAGALKIFSTGCARRWTVLPTAQLSTDLPRGQCSADARSPSSSSLLLAEALGSQPLHVIKQVPSDYSGSPGHTSRWWLFKVFDSRPKTRTVRLLCEAKATASRTPSLGKSTEFKFFHISSSVATAPTSNDYT